MQKIAFLDQRSNVVRILKTIKSYVLSKKVRVELSKYVNIPAREAARRLVVYISASIYSTDLNDFCAVLNRYKSLKIILGIHNNYSSSSIRYTIDQIPTDFINSLVTKTCAYTLRKMRINIRYIVIDGRKQKSYLNTRNNALYSQKDPDAKWTKSTTKGWIFGYNTVFAYDPYSGLFLGVKVYPGNVMDVHVFKELIIDIKTRYNIKNKIVVADKGFLANYNIVNAVRDLEVIPYIIPKKNTNLSRLLNVSADLTWWYLTPSEYIRRFNETKERVSKMNQLYQKSDFMKNIRKRIEHVFSRFQYIFNLNVIMTLGIDKSTRYIQFRCWAFNLIVLCSYLYDQSELRYSSKYVFA